MQASVAHDKTSQQILLRAVFDALADENPITRVSRINGDVHFHVCVVDRVFEEMAGSVIFYTATGIDQAAVAQVQATLLKRILCAFVGRGVLKSCDAKEMLA